MNSVYLIDFKSYPLDLQLFALCGVLPTGCRFSQHFIPSTIFEMFVLSGEATSILAFD